MAELEENLKVFKEKIKNLDPDEFKEKFTKAILAVQEEIGSHAFNQFKNMFGRSVVYSFIFFLFCVLVVLTIFVYFGYKLYKALVDRERRREEKKRQKQQKKKK